MINPSKEIEACERRRRVVERVVIVVNRGCCYKCERLYTDVDNVGRKENSQKTRVRAHIRAVVTVSIPSTLAFCHFLCSPRSLCLALPLSRCLERERAFPPFFLVFSRFLLFFHFFFKRQVDVETYRRRHKHTHLFFYVMKKNSHLPVESALVVIVIDDVATVVRGDECKTTFPHECRRSGLNEGTMRKWRRGEEDFNSVASWSISASNDILMLAANGITFLSFSVRRDSFRFVCYQRHETTITCKNNQTRPVLHPRDAHCSVWQDHWHIPMSCEYKIESSLSGWIVETNVDRRGEAENKSRVSFVQRRENSPS